MKNIFALNRALAKIGRLSLEAQQAVMGVPDLHEMLANNKFTSLDTQIWFEIYGRKKLTNADTAAGLVSRRLNQEQVSFVLKKERRPSVVTAMMRHNTMSLEQLRVLLGNKYVNRAVAEVLYSQNFTRDETFDRDLRLDVAKLSGAAAWADFLAWDSDSSIEESEDLFASLGDERWLPRGSKSHFGRILKRFPSLIKCCVAQDGSAALLQLACGSTVLRETADQLQAIKSAGKNENSHFPLLALANSPFASKEALEELEALGDFSPSAYTITQSLARRKQKSRLTLVGDIASEDSPETLVWLVSRALPFNGRDGSYTPAKVFELEELARNKNLTHDQSRSIAAALTTDPEVLEAFSVDEIESALQVQYARFPDLPRFEHDGVSLSRKFYSVPENQTVDLRTEMAAEQGATLTADAGNTCVGSVDDYFRGEAMLFLESRDLSAEQWRMLLEMAPMMSTVSVEELVQVVSTY